jgi:hypothetical protein
MDTDSDAPRAAAILDDGRADVDALLRAVAKQQRLAGRCVRGLVMIRPGDRASCATEMVLVDIDTAHEYLVSQPMGRDSTSCRADPQGFARASRVLRDALDQSPDLVISNRFGALEAEGAGFTAELLELMSGGVPVLTAVGARHVEAWERFTGGATLLPAEPAAVSAWLEHALSSAATANG